MPTDGAIELFLHKLFPGSQNYLRGLGNHQGAKTNNSTKLRVQEERLPGFPVVWSCFPLSLAGDPYNINHPTGDFLLRESLDSFNRIPYLSHQQVIILSAIGLDL